MEPTTIGETSELRADEDEWCVVGTLLYAPDLFESARRIVTPDDFRNQRARSVFAAMGRLADAGEPSLLTNVLRQLQRDGLDRQEWPSLTNDLLHCYQWFNATHLLPVICLNVARASQRRRLLAASGSVATIAQDERLSTEEAVRAAQDILAKVQRSKLNGPEVLDPIEMALLISRRNQEVIDGGDRNVVSFGLMDLDRATAGGMRPGQLVVIGGRPGMGKSAALRGIARSTASRGVVLFASNEMLGTEIAVRDIAYYSGVPLPVVMAGRWTPEQQAAIHRAEEQIRDTRIVTYTDGAMTSAGLRAKAIELHTQHGLIAVVVDYIQRMADPGKSSLERVGHTARALKSLAIELGVPVIAGSQLNRATERENPDSRPTLIDLRDSGEVEQEADVVLLLYRASYHYPTAEAWHEKHRSKPYPGNTAEIIIAKQRQGVSGIDVKAAWLPAVAAFRDLYVGDDDERF